MAGDFIGAGGVDFKWGDGASPEAFTLVPGLVSLSGLGKTNPLVDVTDFDSAAREYISGLSDGVEITAEFNHDLSDTTQAAIVTAVDNGTNNNVQVVLTDGTDTITYDFAVAPIGWSTVPSIDEATRIQFTLKISGDISTS
jgi:hypothetical protein